MRAVTVLPLPDSPTIASTSPRRDLERHVATACTSPPSVANDDVEVADVDTVLIAALDRAHQLTSPMSSACDRLARGHRVGRRLRLPAAATARAQPRVGEVVEALADERDAEHREHDREPGEIAVHQMPLVTSLSDLFRS